MSYGKEEQQTETWDKRNTRYRVFCHLAYLCIWTD